jgi:integrase
MSTGCIRQRGKAWEIRWPLPPGPDGKRRTATKTVHGSKASAQRALREAMGVTDRAEYVEPSRLTIADLVADRLATWDVGARTRENYEQLARRVAAHLGSIPAQRLTTMHVERWHRDLRAAGLSPNSIRYAHGLLVRVLSDAVRHKLVMRNVAREQPPPKAPGREIKIPTEDQINPMLARLAGTEFYTPAVVTVFCGLRRGELLALRWSDLDLDASTLTIARALDETRAAGVTIKLPKTASSVRTISLPAAAAEALRTHRLQHLEECLLRGLAGC